MERCADLARSTGRPPAAAMKGSAEAIVMVAQLKEEAQEDTLSNSLVVHIPDLAREKFKDSRLAV